MTSDPSRLTQSTSQNGWSVVDRALNPGLVATYTVADSLVRLPLRTGDVATVLLYVADRYNHEVEPLKVGWCWGFAPRLVRGSTTVASNHSSATAIDLNAPAHPMGTSPVSNFTRTQIEACAQIVSDCKGVVRWGGNYVSRKDGMHWEINAGPAAVKALAIQIRREREAHRPTRSVNRLLEVSSAYHRQVMYYQAGLNLWRPSLALVVDGDYGPRTARATRAFKVASGVPALMSDRSNPSAGKLTITTLGLRWTGQ